jgi:hypothetical protein
MPRLAQKPPTLPGARPWRMVGYMYDLMGKTGAGEGIRTLDPDLGKVVLYH